MAAHGTTTVEAKSGYGLSLEAEIKSLEAIAHASQQWPGTVVPTLLGAHVVAPEFRDNPEEYVRIVCDDMIPTAAQRKLAAYVDVFCERGAFSMEQSQRILRTAVRHGLGVRAHVCQLTPAQLTPFSVRRRIPNNASTTSAIGAASAARGGSSPARPRARQFSFDVPAHGFADRLDRTGDLDLTIRPQPSCVARERRQRRFEPMGQIGGAPPGPLRFRIAGVKQRVDFGDERPNLQRRALGEFDSARRSPPRRPRRAGSPAAAARG